MILLDTDHLAVLQYPSPRADQLLARLDTPGDAVGTTIISVEEAFRGWMAEINRHTKASRQVVHYARLRSLLTFFLAWNVLPFDDEAAAQYEELRRLRLRSVGTQDLKIAAVTLTHEALLLSANLAHFRQVPNLRVADWIHDPAS